MSKQVKTKQVKSRQVKAKVPAKAPIAVDPVNKVWLAGLGAVSFAQKQGTAAIDALVAEGKHLQVRGARLARSLEVETRSVLLARLAPVQRRLDALRDEAAARFERGLGRALSYVGVPSKADVDALIKRIDGLARQLRATR